MHMHTHMHTYACTRARAQTQAHTHSYTQTHRRWDMKRIRGDAYLNTSTVLSPLGSQKCDCTCIEDHKMLQLLLTADILRLNRSPGFAFKGQGSHLCDCFTSASRCTSNQYYIRIIVLCMYNSLTIKTCSYINISFN